MSTREKKAKARAAAKAWRHANADRPSMRDVDRLLLEALVIGVMPKDAPVSTQIVKAVRDTTETFEAAGFDKKKVRQMIGLRLKRMADGPVSLHLAKAEIASTRTAPLLPHTT